LKNSEKPRETAELVTLSNLHIPANVNAHSG